MSTDGAQPAQRPPAYRIRVSNSTPLWDWGVQTQRLGKTFRCHEGPRGRKQGPSQTMWPIDMFGAQRLRITCFTPVSNEEGPVDLEDTLDVEAFGATTLRAARPAAAMAHEHSVVLHIWGHQEGDTDTASHTAPCPVKPQLTLHPKPPSPVPSMRQSVLPWPLPQALTVLVCHGDGAGLLGEGAVSRPLRREQEQQDEGGPHCLPWCRQAPTAPADREEVGRGSTFLPSMLLPAPQSHCQCSRGASLRLGVLGGTLM